MCGLALSYAYCFFLTGDEVLIVSLQEAVGDDLDRRWTLCLLLLLEKARGVESFWAAYIDALPTSYSKPFFPTTIMTSPCSGRGLS